MIIGDGKRYSNLAVCLLTKLSAVLMRNADGVFSLFWHTGIVDNPCIDRSVLGYGGKCICPNLGEYHFVIPCALRNEMLNRLMLSANVLWVCLCCYRFHAFATISIKAQ